MRWLLSILCMAVIAPALAQPSGTSTATEAATFGDIRKRDWESQRPKAETEAEKAVQAVIDAVTKRDCAAAVAALNAGLGKQHAEVMMLAATMSEEGICLKPNWDRAVTFYQRALNAGQATAAARLAAGYASPIGGRDKATALWWALRAKTSLPQDCNGVAPLVDDADRFVAALNAWPAGRLDACAYAAAVMAMIQGELGSPDVPAAYGVQGKLKLAFVPAEGKVDVADEGIEAVAPTGLQSAGTASDRNGGRKALLAYAKDVSDRALRRYERPTAVPPTWRAETELVLVSKR